jgi:hypothetical protein
MVASDKPSNLSSVSAASSSAAGDEAVFHEDVVLQESYAAYAAALSVTIAVGCSLLIVNILVLAAVYLKRERSRSVSRRVMASAGSISLGSFGRDSSRECHLAAYLTANSCQQRQQASTSALGAEALSPRGTLRVNRNGVTTIEKRTRFADEILLGGSIQHTISNAVDNSRYE